jgi:hypothetical protein
MSAPASDPPQDPPQAPAATEKPEDSPTAPGTTDAPATGDAAQPESGDVQMEEEPKPKEDPLDDIPEHILTVRLFR